MAHSKKARGLIGELIQSEPSQPHRKLPFLSYDHFTQIIPTFQRATNGGAGFLILTPDLSKVLLVKGRMAGKWGPPKGHAEGHETSLETAIEEAKEETGHRFQFKVPLLPYVVSKGIKLYCVVLPESTPFVIQDKKEIEAILWINIADVDLLMQYHPQLFNCCLKGLYRKTCSFKMVKSKIRAFWPNYSTTVEGFLNQHLFEIQERVRDKLALHPQLTRLETQYIYFNVLRIVYHNIFSYADLYQFVEEQF